MMFDDVSKTRKHVTWLAVLRRGLRSSTSHPDIEDSPNPSAHSKRDQRRSDFLLRATHGQNVRSNRNGRACSTPCSSLNITLVLSAFASTNFCSLSGNLRQSPSTSRFALN